MTRLTTVLLLALVACSKTPEPERTRTDESKAAVVASNAPAKGPSDIAYDVPGTWKSEAVPNLLRKATYKVPKADQDPEDGDLSVAIAAGGVDANITRWAGQFGGATPKKEPRSPNGLKVTVVELAGTYTAGGMAAPQPPKQNWMLLGAVVEAGDQLHFFKLTGPEKTVQAARKDFDSFVASMRAK